MGLTGLHSETERRLRRFDQLMRLNRVPFVITSGYRDPVKQEKLWRAWLLRGRTGLPAARPWCSTHNYGFAVDMVPRNARDLPVMVAIARAAGLRWFGPRDRVHYDLVGNLWPRFVGQVSEGRC